MLYSFKYYGDCDGSHELHSCVGCIRFGGGPAGVAWYPDAEYAHHVLYAAVERAIYRAKLWGIGTIIEPHTLRNISDWGVAWQLWRCWYEHVTWENGNNTQVHPLTGQLTSTGRKLVPMVAYGRWREVVALLDRRYADPDKDRNWARFVQLLTSGWWGDFHAPYVMQYNVYSMHHELNNNLLTWLVYVANAPRKDVVYTTEGSYITGDFYSQTTRSWLKALDLLDVLEDNCSAKYAIKVARMEPTAILRTYQSLLRDLGDAAYDLMPADFVDHVKEFEL